MVIKQSPWRACVAPMMKYTDRHFRYFARILSHRVRLYTEMIVAHAIVKGDAQRFLAHNTEEHPVALQLGGNDPVVMAKAGERGEEVGYCEININAGCPSDRVKSGNFGASLMNSPETVAACVEALKDAVNIPVTVKTRTGIDQQKSYDFLHRFAQTVIDAGCDALIIHARNAWLNGLSPQQNRTIPELNYEFVYRIKEDFADTPIIINGGIRSCEQAIDHLREVDGVMFGRIAYEQPYFLSELDSLLFDENTERISRETAIEQYAAYIKRHDSGRNRQPLLKPLFTLYQGEYGAKQWRRHLNQYLRNQDPVILNRRPQSFHSPIESN